MIIGEEQKKELLKYYEVFKSDPTVVNQGKKQKYELFDEERMEALPYVKSLVDHFLRGEITLQTFKEKSDELSRKYPYWGFKAMSGQMQLNQYNNNIENTSKESFLQECIRVPRNGTEAAAKINKLADYISGLKEQSDYPRSLPRVSQIYMLSYFWEIQDPSRWPIYYGSDKKVLLSLGFKLDVVESYGQEYLEFLKIIDEIINIYTKAGCEEKKYPYWFIEHVLWSQLMKLDSTATSEGGETGRKEKGRKEEASSGAFGEWLPRIITDLNDIAFNKETDWSKERGLRPEKAFETKLRYAFTLLGYETIELGQGTGREPDGVAVSLGVEEGDYALIYDAKARGDKYKLGTNDREIQEYILKRKEKLRRNRISKFYFVIISSEFDEVAETTNSLRNLYRRTQVPVTFLRASDLLFIIENKLQNVEIDHRVLEDLFLDYGLITREKINDIIG